MAGDRAFQSGPVIQGGFERQLRTCKSHATVRLNTAPLVLLVVFIEHLAASPLDLAQKPSGSFTEMMSKNSFSLSKEKSKKLTGKDRVRCFPTCGQAQDNSVSLAISPKILLGHYF